MVFLTLQEFVLNHESRLSIINKLSCHFLNMDIYWTGKYPVCEILELMANINVNTIVKLHYVFFDLNSQHID